jgi:tripartite-type tricarboxylate transporter receptor subunit TctC
LAFRQLARSQPVKSEWGFYLASAFLLKNKLGKRYVGENPLKAAIIYQGSFSSGVLDIPTAKEVGYPGLNVYGWQGVSGPVNLPKEVVEKWDKTLRGACKDPAFLDQAAKIFKVVAYLGPKEFWEFMQDEFKRYLPLAVKMGIRK